MEFIKGSAEKAISGKPHFITNYSHGQMVAMALSSATYAVPGVVWHRFGYTKLGYWMYLVALCSILGDAVVRTDLARVVDRWVAMTGIVSCVVCNATSAANLVLAVVGVLSALWWINHSRRVGTEQEANRVAGRPVDHWLYVWYHGMWHVHGALLCAGITLYCHGHG